MTAVAMPVLVVQLLGATPFEVGVVNAAQFVPYALLGLIAGVYTDRRRGPAIGGGLVGLLGAPVAITVDAISYLVAAALSASMRVDEPRCDSRTRNLRTELRDGLRWTYQHRTVGPLAASTHVWFLANGAALTVLALLALRSLGLTPYTFGLLVAVFGITSLIGASIAPRCGARLAAAALTAALSPLREAPNQGSIKNEMPSPSPKDASPASNQ